jgi:hypothetical protein
MDEWESFPKVISFRLLWAFFLWQRSHPFSR